MTTGTDPGGPASREPSEPVETALATGSFQADDTMFRGLLEAAPDAIVIVRPDGDIVLVNAQTERMFGYGRDELLGQRVEVLLPERFRAAHVEQRADYHAAPRTRPMGERRDLCAQRKDGSEFSAEISLSPLPTPAGTLVISVIRDITERMKLYQDAQEATRVAREAVRARDVFLARASHELRTPLTAALATIGLLKRAAAGRVGEPPDTLIEIASRNLGAMAALIDDLLDLSKLVSGRETLTLAPVAVATVVREGLEVVGAQARDKGVTLRAAVPAGLTVAADRLKLGQVLVNLLVNAVKFTPGRGEVIVEAGAEADSVVIRVRDTGKGIVLEHLEAIFEPFFQAGPAAAHQPGDRRTYPRSIGLGLAICRQIVTLHNGRIWAESDGPGRGSTFVVRLPAATSVRDRVA